MTGRALVKRIRREHLEAIEDVVRHHPDGVTAQEIADALKMALPHRTLQYRLKHLVDHNRLFKEGDGRRARYRLPRIIEAVGGASGTGEVRAVGEALQLPLSGAAVAVQKHVRQPLQARRPVGYDRMFLDSYVPNRSAWLTAAERAHLRAVGTPQIAAQPAGTFARQILNRLLVELAWNSSRLEGNTYSLLDTRRLIEFGQAAEGKERLETQMILNHKDAIEFLVGAVEEIGFNRYTILNLHGILANNLLADPEAPGRLRRMAAGIEQSVFHPLEAPQIIEECFDRILATATAIADPFEQALFAMVQLPYLQPFDDVNKRVSRLAANIPLIRGNLSPLSFQDVPRQAYTEAVLGVYELKQVDLLKDIFIWAYERSAARYAAVRQSQGEPDPFRLRHRTALHELVAAVVRGRMDRKQAVAHVAAWVEAHVEPAEREQFRETAESELLGLHEGNFARYRITPSEFVAWREVWSRSASRLDTREPPLTVPHTVH